MSIKPIAFYLPQFHPVKENSEWWGQGFTEWTNVAKAKPNFEGHYQPHVPKDLGFYDLRITENIEAQASLAKSYGIYGFCFYYYWFNGRRILEKPLDLFLDSDIDLPFCVCWANENWTRTWDGNEKDVLLEQIHSASEDEKFILDLLPILKDPRAINVDGKPMLLVYRPTLFPDSKKTTDTWRKVALENGLKGLHLCTVQFYGITDPRTLGFDAAVEFPPHTFIGPENQPDEFPQLTNPTFEGGIIDYRKILADAISRPVPDYKKYRGIIPSWDNTARRQNNPHTIINSDPEYYEYWLRKIVLQTDSVHQEDDKFIFINAWNEWGEGCHLEPCLKYERSFLEATLRAVNGVVKYSDSVESNVYKFVPDSFVQKTIKTNEKLIEELFAAESDIRRLKLEMQDIKKSKLSFSTHVSKLSSHSPLIHKFLKAVYRKLLK